MLTALATRSSNRPVHVHLPAVSERPESPVRHAPGERVQQARRKSRGSAYDTNAVLDVALDRMINHAAIEMFLES